jgi:hypothetical protein
MHLALAHKIMHCIACAVTGSLHVQHVLSLTRSLHALHGSHCMAHCMLSLTRSLHALHGSHCMAHCMLSLTRSLHALHGSHWLTAYFQHALHISEMSLTDHALAIELADQVWPWPCALLKAQRFDCC